ncbi:MAG: GNAT family N-acetyltransferase [Oscillospiraceae bacterium]|nr:GNAT family N-acetyltransferase [Oscillospiraceae bacterium]
MEIEYLSSLKRPGDTVELYKALEWYMLDGYTDEDIKKANESFYSVYAYDGDTLIGLGRVASDGLIAAVMSGICVRTDYRRHGIGAEIVKRIVDYCQSGIYSMNVQIFCEDSLIKWYEGMGFEKMAVGMRKPMPIREEHCALKKNFSEVYGIEQIAELSEEFYWYDFDAFGDFSYYGGIGSEGVKVPFIRMNLYCREPVKFCAEMIFENVSEFEIGCLGVRTPLFGFDIVNTEKLGYSEKKRYKVRSLEDDDISFFCEKFRVMSVTDLSKTTSVISGAYSPINMISSVPQDDEETADNGEHTDEAASYSEYSESGYDSGDDDDSSAEESEDNGGFSGFADFYYSPEDDERTEENTLEDESAAIAAPVGAGFGEERRDLSGRLKELMETAADVDDLLKRFDEFDNN